MAISKEPPQHMPNCKCESCKYHQAGAWGPNGDETLAGLWEQVQLGETVLPGVVEPGARS